MGTLKLQASRVGYISALALLFLTLTSLTSDSNVLLALAMGGLFFIKVSREHVLFPLVLLLCVVFLSALFNQMEYELYMNAEFRSFLKGLLLGGSLLLYAQDPDLNQNWIRTAFIFSLLGYAAMYFLHLDPNETRPLMHFKNGDPNFAAVFFGVGILFLWTSRAVLPFLVSLPLVFGLLVTQSRMGLFAFFIASLFVVKTKLLRVFLTLGIVGAILFSQTGSRVVEFQDNSNTERLWTYKNAVRVFFENPILGVGWNHSPDTYFDYGFRGPFRSEAQRLHTHNTYLQLLAEHGVLGLGTLLVFIIAMTRGVQGAYLGVAVCLALNALTLPLQNKDFFWLFWILLSISSSVIVVRNGSRLAECHH